MLKWNDRSSWVWVLPDRILIRAKEILDMIGAYGSELGRSRSRCLWIRAREISACLIGVVEIGACGSELGRLVLA